MLHCMKVSICISISRSDVALCLLYYLNTSLFDVALFTSNVPVFNVALLLLHYLILHYVNVAPYYVPLFL